jgi:hypothetical protein
MEKKSMTFFFSVIALFVSIQMWFGNWKLRWCRFVIVASVGMCHWHITLCHRYLQRALHAPVPWRGKKQILWDEESNEPLSPSSRESARRKYRFYYGLDSERDVDEMVRTSCAGYSGWANAAFLRSVVFAIISAQLDDAGCVKIAMSSLGGEILAVSVGQQDANVLEVRRKVQEAKGYSCGEFVELVSESGELLQDKDPIPWSSIKSR